MSGPIQRRLWVGLASAAAAFGAWKTLPGTDLDRAAFTTVARGFANPPLFVTGQGSHSSPWKLRLFSPRRVADKRQAPVIVSLGDDLAGFFQSSPPAPIDIAVILTNFQRLGAKKAATAAVLAWETPDAIGLAALEKSLERFESLVTAAPLSRAAVPSPLPAAFRSASVPLSIVRGDASDLPVVNGIPIPGVILGSGTALAGFSVLEAEARGNFSPLLARWDDRVVFAFPLLAVLQRLDLPVTGVEIRLGEYLKLGPDGPLVPIDRFGRLALRVKPIAAYTEISAEALIDGGDDLFPPKAPDPVILRDDRSAAEPATREFSLGLSGAIAALASEDGLGRIREFPRLTVKQEAGALGTMAVILTILCGAVASKRIAAALVLCGVIVAAQWIGIGMASVWLPGLPLLAAVAAAFVVAALVRVPLVERVQPAVMELIEIPPALLEPSDRIARDLGAPETPPAKKAAKKTATNIANAPAKKTVAKKTAARKSVAPKKKAARKRAPDDGPS